VQDKNNVSDGRWEIFQQQKKDFDAINEIPASHHFKIETSGNPEIMRQEIIRKIKMAATATAENR
jgi:hypothetical protein